MAVKVLAIILIGAAVVTAQMMPENCPDGENDTVPCSTNNSEGETVDVTADENETCPDTQSDTVPCSTINNEGETVDVAPNRCDAYKQFCCKMEDKCVKRDTPLEDDESDETSVLLAQLLDESGDAIGEAGAAKERSLGQLPVPPGLLSHCLPPAPFPANCKPTKGEPYVLDPPVQVPYCVRIPCNPKNNGPLDQSLKLCGSQPGCYFDQALFEYRQSFGPSVLPGVPVCHLAIRNKVFRQQAQKVVQQFGSWNPYFTNCLLNTFKKEIEKGPNGCELIPVVEAFNVVPKMAGWKTITSYECALIDACWRPQRGCFYPVDISSVRVKSGVRSLDVARKEVRFGRPRCQVFDSSSRVSILKSYHRCLRAGCSVDESVSTLYYDHLFNIGQDLTPQKHWDYWGDVQKGLIGPYNIPGVLSEYGNAGAGSGPYIVPPISPKPVGAPFALPGSDQNCGDAVRLYGGRPCKPAPYTPYKREKEFCPYKPFFVPRFPVLKGIFNGCCDINLCYLPKSEISLMHSGPATYYTPWSHWSICDVTCGRGQQIRVRRCVSEDKVYCTEKLVEYRACRANVLCGSWSRWSSWTPCPYTCLPGGIQSRKRQCIPNNSVCGKPTDPREQVRDCNTHECEPSIGPKGDWSDWTDMGCKVKSPGLCQNERARYCTYLGRPVNSCKGSGLDSNVYSCKSCPSSSSSTGGGGVFDLPPGR